MGYPAKVKERAFALYCNHRSVYKVHEILKRDYPGIALSTLKNWQSYYNWGERAENLDKKNAQKADPTASPYEQLLGEVRGIREQIQGSLDLGQEDPITGQIYPNKLDARKAQAVYAFNRMVQLEAKLLEYQAAQEKREGRNTTVEVVFAALEKHPKFAKLLESSKVREELLKKIDEQILDEYRRSVE